MIKIVALTEAGKQTGERLLAFYSDVELLFKPKPFTEIVQSAFKQGNTLIMICATGIAVRTLASVIQNKVDDPPVLVLDESGQFIIPLLSGHEGGANQLAQDVADFLGAQCVITTAKSYLQKDALGDTTAIYTVGMGCEKGCSESELSSLLLSCLQQAELTIDQIESINSIDIKKNEAGLIALAKTLNKPFHIWNADQLGQVESQLSTKSDYVFSVVGAYGVAEPAALFSAQVSAQVSTQTDNHEPAELILTKQKTAKATCAIARGFIKSK